MLLENKVEQLEGMRSENTPTALILSIHIRSFSFQVKTKKEQILAKTQILEFLLKLNTLQAFWSWLIRCVNKTYGSG